MNRIVDILFWALYYAFAIIRVPYKNLPSKVLHLEVVDFPTHRRRLASHPNLGADTIVLLSKDESIEVLERLLINYEVTLPEPAVWNILAHDDILTDSLLLKREETTDFFVLNVLLTRYALTEESFNSRPTLFKQQLLQKLVALGCSLLTDENEYVNWRVTNNPKIHIMDVLSIEKESLNGYKRFAAQWAASLGFLPNMAKVENLPDEIYSMILLRPLSRQGSSIPSFLNCAANPSVPLRIIEELLNRQLSSYGLTVEENWIGDVVKWWSEFFPEQSNALLIRHSFNSFFLKCAISDMRTISPEVCVRLAFHPSEEVRATLAKHTSTPIEVLLMLKDDESVEVLNALATNENLPPECLFSVLSHEQAGAEAFDYLSLADVDTNKGLSVFYYESCIHRLNTSEKIVSEFKEYLLHKATKDNLQGLPFAWVCKMYDLHMGDIDFGLLRRKLENVSLVTV